MAQCSACHLMNSAFLSTGIVARATGPVAPPANACIWKDGETGTTSGATTLGHRHRNAFLLATIVVGSCRTVANPAYACILLEGERASTRCASTLMRHRHRDAFLSATIVAGSTRTVALPANACILLEGERASTGCASTSMRLLLDARRRLVGIIWPNAAQRSIFRAPSEISANFSRLAFSKVLSTY